MASTKMILDLDTGVDDALALALAVCDPRVDLIGVIASYGNTLMKTAAQNTLDLLHLLHADEVPVYLGEAHASTVNDFEVMPISKAIHGDNGVGNILLEKSPGSIEKESGIQFLINMAHQYQDELVYLPTGPLTNLAKALQIDPKIAQLIGNTTLMGGALTVPGNVTPFTEANINQDPQAADQVFTAQEHLTMVGLDVTLRTLLTKAHTKKWRDLGTKAGQTYADLMDYYIDAYDNLGIDHRGAALHDPLAVAVAVDPSYVMTISLNMRVTHDQKTKDYGRTIGDRERLLEPTTTKVAVGVKSERFVHDFMDFMIAVLKN
ncbi:nucleoside hydrolase [Leuconostoc mesenteroides]|uniref:nucleoside hydrolase n=1 Tax=Leuconostoc mesenteroides TaxID=1245 RepID=UPI000E099DF7|nr:nucleoside hydrolase [Leuconostoc mesenteroides]RDF93584.1 nucleoside hydrolase [Leuconostoc mesenteroides subsp. mesenteroides]